MPVSPATRSTRIRRHFIGGTDVPKILGISTWGTPMSCWLEKLGRAPPEKFDPARAQVQRRGKKLEPYVADMTLDKLRGMGHDVQIVAKNRRHVDAAVPYLSAEIDRELILDGQPANLEIKTATGHARAGWGDEETDAIPLHYTAQVMHGLGITGQRRCVVGALLGLDDVAIYFIDRDDDLVAGMRARCVEFWEQHVLREVPPDPVRFADVSMLYPVDNDRTVEASPEVAAAVRDLRTLRHSIKRDEVRAESLRLLAGAYMRDSAALTVDGRAALTFRSQTSRRLDIAALRRDHPDIAALYEVGGESRAMRMVESFSRRKD